MLTNWKNKFVLQANRSMRSVYYRLILVGYGILLSWLYENPFPFYAYILVYCFYIVFLFKIFMNSKIHSWMRSAIDLILIVFSLYGKPLDNITTISMIFVPIANAINHTGDSKGSKYYIISLFLAYLLLTICCQLPEIFLSRILYILVPFTAFFLIHQYTVKEWLKNTQDSELQDVIDDYCNHGARHEEVYNNIMNFCQKYGLSCQSIYCFITHDHYKSLHIVNASKFVYNYSVNLTDKQMELCCMNAINLDADITIDGIKLNRNFLIPANKNLFRNNTDETEYLFVLTFPDEERGVSWFISGIETPLRRFAKLLYTERMMKMRRREYNEQIKVKGRFVENAINTMHFIKNRLSSVQTLADVVNDTAFSEGNTDYIDVAKDAAKRSEIDIRHILEKAKYLLNKDNNPFHYQKVEDVRPRTVFAILRTVWDNTFGNIQIEVDNIVIFNDEGYFVKVNMEGLEILFSDIVANMGKYQKANSSCRVSCSSTEMNIIFNNDFTDLQLVENLVKSYNEDSKEEITKRKTYGVSNIKSFVSDMNIDLFSFIEETEDDKLFCMVLTFKIFRDENTNYRK